MVIAGLKMIPLGHWAAPLHIYAFHLHEAKQVVTA
jgi:hypothetical protein